MDDASIQQASSADAEAITQLLIACRDDLLAQGIGQWVGQYPTLQVVWAAIADTFVVRVDGRVAATITLDEQSEQEYEQVRWLTPLGQRALVVHRLAVHPSFQRRGLARRLMHYTEQLATQRGIASIRLDAFSGNPAALALYDGLGYRRVGEVYFPHRDLPFVCLEKVLKTS